jgi:hypothetical protein
MAQGSTARRPDGQQVAYLRKRLLRSGGATQTVSIGKIPKGSNITRVVTSTRVEFDGTTPVFSLGVTGTLAGLVASAANGLTALGFTAPTIVADNALAVPDTDIEVLATFSVTAGTVGTADIQVEFIPPDEVPS